MSIIIVNTWFLFDPSDGIVTQLYLRFCKVSLSPVSPWCPILAGEELLWRPAYPGIYAGQSRIRGLRVSALDNDV
jgi:hypothetical protein